MPVRYLFPQMCILQNAKNIVVVILGFPVYLVCQVVPQRPLHQVLVSNIGLVPKDIAYGFHIEFFAT